MTREALTQHEISDEDLARLVTESIAWDSRIHYSHIRVSVDHGVVFLAGTVERLSEKAAAEEVAARVKGVTQVISNILVMPEREVTDKEIEKSVKEALDRDARLDADHIEVASGNGVITLRGEVLSGAQKWAALDDAALTYGVRAVVDELSVLPEQPPGDHALEELAQSVLDRSGSLGQARVHVHVSNGIAHLGGTVDHLYQKIEASRITAGIPGIRGVENEISVRR